MQHAAIAAGRKDSARKNRRAHQRAAQDAFEQLESRLMLAFSAHVNFQPSGASTPAGYIADVGLPYASRNGQTYGWQYSNTHTRERYVNSDQRYDTLAHMQYKGGSAKWEIAVPNGAYKVHLVSGDPSYTNSLYKINAEGSLLLFGIPSASKKYIEATANVTVRDGRLTLTNAAGAVNNKINYIDIAPATTTTTSPTPTTAIKMAPAVPSNLAASGISTSQIRLNWKDNSTRESGYYVERSTDNGSTYSRIGTLGANSNTFLDGGRTSGKTYYYRVAAHNTYGTSAWVKDTGRPTSVALTIAPAAPTMLTASGASTSQIRLNWKDNSSRESGHYVERSTDAGKTYARIATVGAGTTTYLDGGRTVDKTYYYRVAAYNSYGTSGYVKATGRTQSSGSGTTAPAAPTGLRVSGASSTSIRLNWEDNSSRESGYQVERSDDGGKTYNKIATVSANTTTHLDSGRTTGKTYFYRVAAYVSSLKSSYSYATGTTTSASASPQPSGGYYDGVAIGMGGDVAKAIPILRALNIKAVRLWDGLSAWSNRWSTDTVLQNAIKYHNAGFKVTLLTTCVTPPTYSQAKAYFDWVQKVPGLKAAVDFWEIGNEPDLTKYYKGTLEHYVQNELRAAWDSLHPAGEKVIGGATIFASTAQRAKDAGYLNYVDYANVHPYNSTVSGLRNDMANFKAIFSSKPLVATEWNFHYVTDKTKWAQYVQEMHQYLDDYFVAAYYFGFEVNGTGSGGGGLVYDGSYAKNTLFYNAVDNWYANTSSASSAPTTSDASAAGSSTNPLENLFSNSQIL